MKRVITLFGQVKNSITNISKALLLFSMIFFVCFCLAPSAKAQGSEQNSVRSLQVSKVANKEVKIDGHLNENSWQQAAVATGFTQREPKDGAPASERTEVRVL